MAQQSQTEHQEPYTIPSQRGVADPSFTNIGDIEAQRTKPSATTDDTGNHLKFVPKFFLVLLGSTYCLVILCVLLIVPIIELAIGASFRDQCPINPNIPQYLVVSGACGLISILLTLAIVGSFICLFKRETPGGSIAVGVIIGVLFLIIFLLSIFLFAWFIAGNVWVFGARKNIVYDDPTSMYYCHRTVYQFAFTIIILTYVMTGISCLSSCLRSCCGIFKSK